MNGNLIRLGDYLDHILEAIGRIEQYTQDMDENGFLANSLVQDAVVRNFEVIGEACRNIQRHYPDFLDRHKGVPVSGPIQMRNALSHGYFKVDYALLWATIEVHLPPLQAAVRMVRPLYP